MHGAVAYAYILHGTFVALEIIGGIFMRVLRWIRLFSECYKIAGWCGLKACAKYLCGRMMLDDFGQKCFEMGDVNA